MFVQTIHDDDRNRAIVEAIINGAPIHPCHGEWDVEDLARIAAVCAFVGMFQIPRQGGPDVAAAFMAQDDCDIYESTHDYYGNFRQACNAHIERLATIEELNALLADSFLPDGWEDQ